MRPAFLLGPWLAAVACAAGEPRTTREDFSSPPPAPEPTVSELTANDAGVADASDEFTTCAAASVEAKRERLPVDIIWVVDNSASMAPAVAEVQAGLNSFASIVASKGLDYKMVMLSLRGTDPVSIGGKTLYPVCIPPPLGGASCGNSTLFFHAPMNVQSTQPLEQILGSLDQTTGYTDGTLRGSVPWAQELRANATKSFVLVTDDNSRFPAVSFENFPGGDSPYTGGLVLPPGLLHPSRNGAWKGYSFNAIYGYGNTVDPSYRCTYPDNSKPPASGSEYTTLIQKTGGARAQICTGSAAWGPFFNAIATAVEATARVACELSIPTADAGVIDPNSINVRVSDGTNPSLTIPRVQDASACATSDGWYYDAPLAPTKVILCPTSCENAQAKGASFSVPKVEVLFGCQTIIR